MMQKTQDIPSTIHPRARLQLKRETVRALRSQQLAPVAVQVFSDECSESACPICTSF